MRFEFKVYVRSPDFLSYRKRCFNLGHQFYRCGNCGTLIKIFSKSNHDPECSGCEWKVYILTDEEW